MPPAKTIPHIHTNEEIACPLWVERCYFMNNVYDNQNQCFPSAIPCVGSSTQGFGDVTLFGAWSGYSKVFFHIAICGHSFAGVLPSLESGILIWFYGSADQPTISKYSELDFWLGFFLMVILNDSCLAVGFLSQCDYNHWPSPKGCR